ncbi:MAG: hypothetical protein J6S44_02240 [Clostridia bacterium]|nr:hypothetical protein [Clostridia bacterium]
MKRLVGLGANVLDSLISCESFPVEDKKIRAEKITLSGGGPVGNALVIASKLGAPTVAIGALADDEAGARILSELKQFGVNVDGVQVVPHTTSFVSYVILSESRGSRTCLYHRGTVPDDAETISLSAIDADAILHLDGNYLKSALKAARYAKEVGALVSLDAGGLYEGIEELLPLVDILIPSAEFAMGLTGMATARDAMLALYERYHPHVLVVTDGENGGYDMENGEALCYDSFKVKAVDSNGAGDTFHGAFLSEYMKGAGVYECCRFAGAVSAYKCIHKGVRTFDLNRTMIHAFMGKQK